MTGPNYMPMSTDLILNGEYVYSDRFWDDFQSNIRYKRKQYLKQIYFNKFNSMYC